MAKKPKKKKEGKQSAEATVAVLSYPFWAKFVVAVVIFSWCGFAALFSGGLYASVQFLQKATDPVYVAQKAKTVADFAYPLPDGFKYTFTGSMLNFNVVTVMYEPDGSVFVIGTKPIAEMKTDDARKVVDNPGEFNLPYLYVDMKVESKGSMEVGGRTLEYVAGSATDQKERTMGSFIGCAMLKDKNSALIVYAITPDQPSKPGEVVEARQTAFNLKAANKLFSAIKGF